MMSASGDISNSSTMKTVEIGGDDDDEKKMCTSYEQILAGVDGTSSINEMISRLAISDDELSSSRGANFIRELQHLRKLCIVSDNDNIDDEKLFADPPPKDDCPICMQPVPYASGLMGVRTSYSACCGKMLCDGCVVANMAAMKKGLTKKLCAFCRLPIPNSKEMYFKRIKKRMDMNDFNAFDQLGYDYEVGDMGLTKDSSKALELWKKSAELGSVFAHCRVANEYRCGNIVESDMAKAFHHWRLAAIGGHEQARHNLGLIERQQGNLNIGLGLLEKGDSNMVRAYRHFLIAARCGYDDSLKKVGDGYKAGYVTKDEYASTLRVHKACRDRMKSKERDKATAKLKSTNGCSGYS